MLWKGLGLGWRGGLAGGGPGGPVKPLDLDRAPLLGRAPGAEGGGARARAVRPAEQPGAGGRCPRPLATPPGCRLCLHPGLVRLLPWSWAPEAREA